MTTAPQARCGDDAEPTVVVTVAKGRRTHLANLSASLADQIDGNGSRIVVEHVLVDLGGADPRKFIDSRLATTIVELPAGDELPLAAARNTGWRRYSAPVTIFLDVDCIARPDLVATYAALVDAHPGVHAGPVGYLPAGAPATIDADALEAVAHYHDDRPTPATPPHTTSRPELFWSLSFAVDRASWERIGGFDERYVGYGGEDTDFASRARALAVPIWFSGHPGAFHQHHPVSSPPVEHLHAICRNATRFRRTWGTWPMVGWLERFDEMGLIDWSADRCRPRFPSDGRVERI